MKIPNRHRNITAKRLVLDFYQFIRVQSPVVRIFGRQFKPSLDYAEIDITYKCNLKCFNCNRSCTQAPSSAEMPASMIDSFLQQSIARKIQWKRIRLLGGEPTLHSRIFDIIDLLNTYRSVHNPDVRLVLGTNYYGQEVHRILKEIPDDWIIKSTLKRSRENLFRPFNVAPVDTCYNRFSDYTCGCRIIRDCGMGVTPFGYYMCAVAGGIDRIFHYHIGRKQLPEESDPLTDQMEALCRLCGHFGFQWPVKNTRISKSWRNAYAQVKINRSNTILKTAFPLEGE